MWRTRADDHRPSGGRGRVLLKGTWHSFAPAWSFVAVTLRSSCNHPERSISVTSTHTTSQRIAIKIFHVDIVAAVAAEPRPLCSRARAGFSVLTTSPALPSLLRRRRHIARHECPQKLHCSDEKGRKHLSRPPAPQHPLLAGITWEAAEEEKEEGVPRVANARPQRSLQCDCPAAQHLYDRRGIFP